jgi:thiol-disulfide isomerase/thioredoxin
MTKSLSIYVLLQWLKIMSLRLLAVFVLTISTLPLAGAPKDAPKSDLTLKDAKGQKVRLRDLRGKAVVLNFWATWCGPCKAEMPLLVEMEKAYGGRGVVFVGASLDDDQSKALVPAFAAAHNVDFAIWYGATGDDLAKLELGEAVPATAFLDQEGRIVARVLGQLRKEDLQERLDWLTGDRKGPAPQAVVKHLENLNGK